MYRIGVDVGGTNTDAVVMAGREILAAGRDALVPLILDGENAWEYYDRNGRPFFRELYAGIEADPAMRAVTVSEAHGLIAPEHGDDAYLIHMQRYDSGPFDWPPAGATSVTSAN